MPWGERERVIHRGGPGLSKMDFLFGKKSEPGVEVFTENPNNEHSPLVVIGGIHVYPEGFGIIIVFVLLYTVFLRRNYRVEKAKAFYE